MQEELVELIRTDPGQIDGLDLLVGPVIAKVTSRLIVEPRTLNTGTGPPDGNPHAPRRMAHAIVARLSAAIPCGSERAGAPEPGS